jgi:hypothetical protein
MSKVQKAGSFAYVLVRGIGIADAQILRNGSIEKQRLLENDTDVAPEALKLDVTDVAAVDFHFA